jgi:hypothetical protein
VKRTALLLLALASSVAACSRHEARAERCPPTDAGTPVDPVLLAFLSRARAAHHVADNQETAGDLAGAVLPLQSLVEGPLPRTSSAELAPEVREVLADTRARLADLRSRQGAFDAALRDAHAGLEMARDPNYFRGHLLETEGLVEERHAKALDKTDALAAASTRKRAISLLEQAMSVQSGVIEAAPASSVSGAIPAASATPATSAH